jgi:hypothetical protein
MAMSQIMEADPRNADPRYDLAEIALDDIVRVKWLPVRLAEDEAVVGICELPMSPSLLIPDAAQFRQKDGCEGNRAA